MMNELYELCDNLKDEIKQINAKGDISPTELENAYKAVDIIKDIKTIEAMEEAGNSYEGSYEGSYDDYSRSYYRDGSYRDGSYRDDGSYERSYARGGRDGDGDGRYSEEGSYRRSRDRMGRYSSRDGYSGEEKEQMMRQIEQMRRKIEQM